MSGLSGCKIMEYIYIVMGNCGEYDDRSEWIVIAYRDEAMAQAHVLGANEESHRISLALEELDTGEWETFLTQRDALVGSNAYDPNMQNDYPRASYAVQTVELATALPGKTK